MCIIHTLATIAIVSVMGIPVLVQHIEEEKARNSLTIMLAGTASVCFAFFGVPVGPLVDGGVLKILGKNKDQYGKNVETWQPQSILSIHLFPWHHKSIKRLTNTFR
jgi:hypothetical protein